MGPLAYYTKKIDEGEIQFDPAQEQAVLHLQNLFDLLVQPEKQAGAFAKFFGSKPQHAAHTGLYFWGGVGRGKTFLMDVFFESLPLKEKKRLHFLSH